MILSSQGEISWAEVVPQISLWLPHAHTRMHIHAHTCIYIHMHAHTCTYMLTLIACGWQHLREDLNPSSVTDHLSVLEHVTVRPEHEGVAAVGLGLSSTESRAMAVRLHTSLCMAERGVDR